MQRSRIGFLNTDEGDGLANQDRDSACKIVVQVNHSRRFRRHLSKRNKQVF
jgi:hypothetical protein